MAVLEQFEVQDGVGVYRPRGECSLVDAMDLVSRAIALCRERGINRLLVDATGFVNLPVPTLLDRFLMVEEWAHEGMSIVVVAMIASPEYIHPCKFGVKVALEFGLICDVYSSEEAASAWLSESANPAG